MPSYKIMISAAAGSVLFASSFGVLLFGFDFGIIWLAEAFAELIGVLPSGWADGHLGWLLTVSVLITVPLVIGVFVLSWRKIIRTELALAREESLAA